MRQEEIRQRLIDGTIQVIAKDGLDKASTKQIGSTTSVNEAYIYRCFADKEDMFAKTFDSLDEELLEVTMAHIEVMYQAKIPFEERCRQYFFELWGFLLKSRDKCLPYMQYFYSPYFARRSAPDHMKRFLPLVARFKAAFIDEADVWMILNHILNVMLDFAVKVHNGQMSDSEMNAEHVFRVTYASVKQYFKTGEKAGNFSA